MNTVSMVLLPLVEGFEEIEAISIIDILRRAQLQVTVAGIGSSRITGSHQITVETDTTLEDLWSRGIQTLVEGYQALVLPGGPGTRSLQADQRISQLVQAFFQAERGVGALCAAPMVLAQAGILAEKKATSYYSPEAYEKALTGQSPLPVAVGPIGIYALDPVVVDGRVITSRGAGTAVEFALQLVAEWVGIQQAKAIASGIHSSWQPS
jgi:4-methyl-5(b-hydroxyethyl)-thiazole monophosphate biosynthesis